MIPQTSLVVILVQLIDRLPEPPKPPQKRGRGRSRVYSDRVFLKAIVMQFKSIFEGHEQVPTKGKVATRRSLLGAVLVYQLALWYRFEQGLPLRIGLKAFLQAA